MSKKQSKQFKKKKKQGSTDQDTLKGVLDITRSGVGYVIIPEIASDVLVRPGDFNTALHGDTVRVKVVSGGRQSNRQQGRIVEVVKRKQTEFMGKIELGKTFAFFIADMDKPMPDIFVPLTNLKGEP